MLRTIRLTLAVVFFALLTLLFLDFTGTLHGWFGWMARIQFLPALLALNVGVVVFLLLLTLVFGRVYCSVICPLGVFQDLIARVGRRRKKLPYSYSPALSWLRYGMLGVFIIALVAGMGAITALLDPYGAYGRMANNLLAPLWQWGNNVLAYFAERAESYAFYTSEVWLKSVSTLIVSVATLAVVGVLAWRNGRTYCNTVCPVGTVLGFFSRFSLLRVAIDTEKCNGCGICARNCKAACIDAKQHQVDYSRCVVCMDCLGKCKKSAIGYQLRRSKPAVAVQVETVTALKADNATQQAESQPNDSRRSFLTATALLASTSLLKAQEMKVDGGLAEIQDKKIPNRLMPLVPAGASGLKNFAQHCTACQLCVSACPNQVLRPSSNWKTLMQPEMSYERGYCRPECVKCSEVCPAGAIRLVTKEDKSSIQIGHARWIKDNCIVLTDEVECGNCARHCPVASIQMVPMDAADEKSRKIPVVNEERCIGCGACENLCPSRPFSAILVEGHERHRTV